MLNEAQCYGGMCQQLTIRQQFMHQRTYLLEYAVRGLDNTSKTHHDSVKAVHFLGP